MHFSFCDVCLFLFLSSSCHSNRTQFLPGRPGQPRLLQHQPGGSGPALHHLHPFHQVQTVINTEVANTRVLIFLICSLFSSYLACSFFLIVLFFLSPCFCFITNSSNSSSFSTRVGISLSVPVCCSPDAAGLKWSFMQVSHGGSYTHGRIFGLMLM